MLLFVGFLVNDLGELTLHNDTWPYLIPLGGAAALGYGTRWIRAVLAATGHPDDEVGDVSRSWTPVRP